MGAQTSGRENGEFCLHEGDAQADGGGSEGRLGGGGEGLRRPESNSKEPVGETGALMIVYRARLEGIGVSRQGFVVGRGAMCKCKKQRHSEI